MDTNSFIYACEYDRNITEKNRIEKNPVSLLVFDIDSYSFGFCSYEKGDDARLLFSYSLPGNGTFRQDLLEMAKSFTPFFRDSEMIDVLNKQKERIDDSTRLFYVSDGQIDNPAIVSGDKSISSSRFMEGFGKIKEKIETLMSEADKGFEKTGFKEEDTNILLINETADLYPLRYFFRVKYSFDPFLADDRFRNEEYPDESDSIIAKGKELYKLRDKAEYDVVLSVCDDSKEGTRSIRMMSKDLPKDNYKEANYTGPIVIYGNDAIHFVIDSKEKEVRIPFDLKPDRYDVIELALCLKKSIPVLSVRRVDEPEKIYSIPLIENRG